MNRYALTIILAISGLLREVGLAMRLGVSDQANTVFQYLPLAAIIAEYGVVIVIHNRLIPSVYGGNSVGKWTSEHINGFIGFGLAITSIASIVANSVLENGNRAGLCLFVITLSLYIATTYSTILPFMLGRPSLFCLPFIILNMTQVVAYVMLPRQGIWLYPEIAVGFAYLAGGVMILVLVQLLKKLRKKDEYFINKSKGDVDNRSWQLMREIVGSIKSAKVLIEGLSSPVFLLLGVQFITRLTFTEINRSAATINYAFRLSELPITVFVTAVLPALYLKMSREVKKDGLDIEIESKYGLLRYEKGIAWILVCAPAFVIVFCKAITEFHAASLGLGMFGLSNDIYMNIRQVLIDAILFAANGPAQIILYVYSRCLYLEGKGGRLGLSILIGIGISSGFLLLVEGTSFKTGIAGMPLFNILTYYIVLLLARRDIGKSFSKRVGLGLRVHMFGLIIAISCCLLTL